MAVKKITRRWLFNSFGVIVVIIVLVEVAFAFAITNYYYSSVRAALANRAAAVNTAFEQYREDPSVTDVAARIASYVADFAQADDKVELMTLDSAGVVAVTSSGFEPDEKENLADYEAALEAGDWVGSEVGVMNSQRVMALTAIAGEDLQQPAFSAVRVVTSLQNVDRQIMLLVIAMILLGILVLIMVLFSSSYFIGSIVNPIGEVGETARKIAGGNFSARLQKRNDDEIGELSDIINYMAGELANSEQLKNDFISSVSHELRTPLTAIQGWAETLLSDGGEDKEILEKGMGVIIGETARLSSMVEELLDFSRMQSGRLKLVRSRMDAMAELSEAVLMYTERACREHIALVYDEDERIAPVYGDKNKLRQVFINIIDNAIKYSDSGGTVTVGALVADSLLTITVADTGVGIPPEALPSVKQKFYKAESTRRGSGIGLAVADEIVTRHGGTLDVASRYHFGTTVTITLPLYKGQDEAIKVQEE